ncbi:lysophospholipid acyltransferase family protein [Thiomonas sp. FB-6]|uniref:lysophospholipid acyltransferase family protein n=1 Tax=Thiomonas sp. FB-6 TaxID=1158291 RepID=UPI00035DC35D|nr:lysophospholipid acyltransferase family protein [Thiomonas sp. FB-6]
MPPSAMLRLFRVLSLLPLGLLQAGGGVIGLLVYAASPRYRRVLRHNLAQAGFASRALALRAAMEAGRMAGELPFVWLRDGAGAAVRRVRVSGREAVEQAWAEGRGVLYLTPHLGCFEVAAQVAAQWGPITVLYRPPHKAWLNPLAGARLRHNLRTAPASVAGMRPLLRALRNGEAVGMLPDQAPSAGDGVWAPFFGRPAYTMTLPVRLARLTGARIVFAVAERLPRGAGYRLNLRALQGPLPEDPRQAAARLNREIEELVRTCPRQYLWGYNRYKVPAGAPLPPAGPEASP